MRRSLPAVTVEDASDVVEDGNVLTSAGISAGSDMALRVVVRYFGESVGRATARHMEYPFPEDNRRRVTIDPEARPRQRTADISGDGGKPRR